jgi:dimethylglycine dehydrogenase
MKTHARAVVIGGGVVGASVLYHLTKAGWSDVMLLEKHELTSGSTWHAAAGVHTYNSDANVSKLQKYTIDLYREIEKVSGQSCGIHPTGNMVLAATEEIMDNVRLMHARAKYLGLETQIITPSEAKKHNPLIDENEFVGALWRADGGHVDPNGVTHAYTIAARKAGAEVHRFTAVTGLEQRTDGSWDVITDKGVIHAEHVVNAAGLWAREVGRMAGIELPVLAMEHMYIITEEIPEVANFHQEIMPSTDYSGEIYLRQEGRGILMGTYEQDCRVWSPDETPWDFHMQLLPDDLERLSPHLEIGFKHFPAVGRAGIKKVVNGPFTFAPDGNPLVGPVRGLRNYWSACGVMAGFAQGGGVGLALSRWMVDGDPGADIFAMDVARFGAFASKAYTNIKVVENYRRRFRIAYPNEELTAARPLRRTPAYDRLKAAGAVFGANFGLEVPLWYAPKGTEAVEIPTYRRSNAFPVVKAECKAVRDHVGLMEISGFGKYEITGTGAESWLDRMLAAKIPKVGRMILAPMLNERGTILGDFSLARLSADRFLMIGSGVAEVYHMRWFEQHLRGRSDVQVRALPHALNGFMIAGPESRQLLQRLVKDDVSNDKFKFFAAREMTVGLTPATVIRASYTGDLGYEIWCTPDYQVTLYESLVEAGRDLGLVHFGGRALMSLRLEKGYGAFFREFRPDYTPKESGLDRFIAYDKGEFIGRKAALKDRDSKPTRRLVTMIVDTDVEVVGYESILQGGEAVGQVTSGGYAHWADKSIALGYVRADLARDGETLTIPIFAEERRAIVHMTPLFDANGGRQRG